MTRRPRNVAEAYALAPPGTTPSAAEVRAIMRAQNFKVALLALAFLVMGGASIWFSATGRTAAETSAETTSAALASNSRAACIEARRNDEIRALGVMLSASARAQIAGLLLDDDGETARQVARFEAADIEREKAADSLEADVLRQPPPVGCGEPITQTSDIPDDD